MSERPRIGEIIATSTLGFTAQAAALHALPALGSLVTVCLDETGNEEVVAVVTYGETAGVDAGRRAVRRGSDEVFDHSVYREHPELAHVLRSIFEARTVGSFAGDEPRPFLPPTPPPLHYSVRPCAAAEVRAFTDDLVYLRMLLTAEGAVSPEHLLAAHVRAVAADRPDAADWLPRAGREVARLFKEDYDRLLTVLQAIDPGRRVAAR